MKKNKYGNIKVEVDLDGQTLKFDSKMEHERWAYLKLLEKAGEIRGLDTHPSFLFRSTNLEVIGKSGRVLSYRADLQYYRKRVVSGVVHWEHVVEDVKGFRTKDFNLKFALAKAMYPYTLFYCVTKDGKAWKVTDW